MKKFLASFFALRVQPSITLSTIVLFLLTLSAQADPTIWRVDANSTSYAPDGSSWASAYSTIQDAIDAAVAAGASETNPAEIWVAAGTYGGLAGEVEIAYENSYSGSTRTLYFAVIMSENVDLYGGFSAQEAQREERDWRNNSTVITGQGSRNCVFAANNTTLNGFVIENGSDDSGAGIFSKDASILIQHCAFSNNASGYSYGGGIYAADSSLWIEDCAFSNNSSSSDGGAIYAYGSGIEVINSTFFENRAGDGAALCSDYSTLSLINCTISGNRASYGGGALDQYQSSTSVMNCIFWGNGQEISGDSDDISITYSCVSGGYRGEGNIETAPLFWSPLRGDFRLHSTSPCIDTAINSGLLNEDIRGVQRPQGQGIDMGAYEMNEVDSDGDGLFDDFEIDYALTDPMLFDSDNNGVGDGEAWLSFPTIYVNINSQASNPNGLSWEEAFTDLQSGVDAAYTQGGGEVWVAQGVYTNTGDAVLLMRPNLALYGGFLGEEYERDQRDAASHETVIDGEGSRRCVYGENKISLDGFTFHDGYASYTGGAMSNRGLSSVQLSNCCFNSNHSDSAGGAVYNDSASPTFENCLFFKNSARSGGAIYNADASPLIMNCTFYANSVTEYGGAIYNNSYSYAIIQNSIFNYNEGEIYTNYYTRLTISYSCTEIEYDGVGNITANPLFWNPLEGDFRLHPDSPCLDAASQERAPEYDMRGHERPQGEAIDMGAYEMGELDTDSDGLMDDFELLYSLTDPSLADSDEDGQSDGEAWFGHRIWYVKADSQALDPDGSSWENAFSDIQSAVKQLSLRAGGEIWVAEGAYYGEGAEVVSLCWNSHLYGGFLGTETDRDERDWRAYPSIIDGEGERRCVLASGNSSLDGFTLRKGEATRGGGLLSFSTSSMLIKNLLFSENTANYGAGLYNSTTETVAINCRFEDNVSDSSGGAIYNVDASLKLTNAMLKNNSAYSGAGIYSDEDRLSLLNCTLFNNVPDDEGGGIYANDSIVSLTNCILWGNQEEFYQSGGSVSVSYSCVEGGYTGEGNVLSNPLFWNPGQGDLRLHAISPCLDTGLALDAVTDDLRGLSRPQGLGVDMGAYEMNEVDSDGDGLMDDFELLYSHTDPALADSDGDGVSDGDLWFNTKIFFVNIDSRAAVMDGLSWTSAFRDIQSAVDTAYARGGGEIWVAQGVYLAEGENVVLMRDKIQLYGGFLGTETERSERNWDQRITIIDGGSERRCIQGANSITLDGFTLRNGKEKGYYDGEGGALFSRNAASVSVKHCVFQNNTAYRGGAIYTDSATLTISDCLFFNNSASDVGGALYQRSSPVTLVNCIFKENTAEVGGAIYQTYYSLSSTNCLFYANVAEEFGGVLGGYSTAYDFMNCTVWGNSAYQGGGAVYSSSYSLSLKINNSIFWSNGQDLKETCEDATVQSSCIQGGFDGTGNTDETPLFWSPNSNDFRLHPSSPCLNTASAHGAPEKDIRGVARPQGKGIDMGALEMEELDSDGDGLMDEFELLYASTDPNDPDSDGDGQSDGEQWFAQRIWYVDQDSTALTPNGKSWESAFRDIQSALDAAAVIEQNEVWVAEGNYTGENEEVLFLHSPVLVYGGFSGEETERSQRDWNGNSTIIDGEQMRRCVKISADATLDGFIIRNGAEQNGAGAYLEGSGGATISHCTFSNNTASSSGGAILNAQVLIELTDCSFRGNSARYGGALYLRSCTAQMSTCSFLRNAASSGGGAFMNQDSQPKFVNSVFVENSASFGGGGYTGDFGDSYFMNCTFGGNSAEKGGALSVDYASQVLINCVLWGNGDEIDDEDGDSNISYSCIQDGYHGEGNIATDPMYLSLAQGDLRLLVDSPCNDAGTIYNAPDIDFLGIPRPQGEGIDMGAYEYDLGEGEGEGEGEEIIPGCSCAKQGEVWDDFKYYLADYLLVALSLMCMLAWRRYK